MRKEYTINELADILGCSRTAIVKKIKEDESTPGIKRYKDRYEVGVKNGQIVILLDDEDLEQEKSMSRGFKNVSQKGYDTPENDNTIDVEPIVKESKEDKIINFTERYIDRFTTLQETMYNELKQRDNQILLLTTSENAKQEEYLKTVAENKTLKSRNTVLMVLLGVIITVLVCVISFFITFITVHDNVTKTDNTIQEQQTQISDIKKEHAPQIKKHAR